MPGNIDLLKQTECESVEKIDSNVAQESRKQCDFDKINITNTTTGHNKSNARMNSDASNIGKPGIYKIIKTALFLFFSCFGFSV